MNRHAPPSKIRPLPDGDARSRVIVALDFPGEAEAESFLKRWSDRDENKPFVKVGLQLLYAAGPGWAAALVERGYPVFLDVKLHDIPHTVSGAIRSLCRLGVTFITLHAAGGSRMMEAAREAAESAGGSQRPLLLAVTQLTSTDRRMLNEELGIPGHVEDAVVRMARLARDAGMDGVVCSGEEVERIKKASGDELLAITPGIRLKPGPSGDQKRVVTPETAVARGADFLVVGRPVTRSADPVQVYREIVERLKQGRGNTHE